MLLKVKRAQKSSMMGAAIFTLDFQAEISKEERALIEKYKLGKMIVYSSEAFQKNAATAQDAVKNQSGFLKGMAAIASSFFNLKISIEDLVGGKHLEMKDLEELVSAEEQVVKACNNLKGYLSVAKSFDGRTDTIEI